ncbi:MAG: lipid-A-disaccharide synthase [Bacteroidetes bacterium]|nr:lipid-A-disaccharide synthase [Bacteroidota bacterium]MBS1648072.1 lipid-A-disaccharide synthase [Bacteroidota bacterium]
MKYYIISGEASGDLHGSNLIKQLLLLDASANVHCWGGDLMETAGGKLIKHYKELAFMGFAEVVKNLPTIFRNIKFCKQDIANFKPDVLVLIDYPGFNLRIAEWAKQQGYKVVYYISPQVWAWKENRVKKMKQCIDKMLCILPFEKEYYQNKWNWNVEYVGHPLVEVIESSIANKLYISSDTSNSNFTLHTKQIIALLPGSRKQEIAKKLPIMLEVSKSFPNYQFIVAQAPGQDDNFYKPFLQPYHNVSTIKNNTYQLLMQSIAALVTSGTATLETALFAVPEVVCYKGSNISYQIAKKLIKIKYISLVNLIMNKLVVKELIQNDLTVDNITKELNVLLNDVAKQQQLQNDYADLKKLLSSGGNASKNAATIIYDFAKGN